MDWITTAEGQHYHSVLHIPGQIRRIKNKPKVRRITHYSHNPN